MGFQALQEGCIASILSRTTPADVCRLSLVSKIFRSAAESNAVWERFLPPDYRSIISQSSSPLPNYPSTKELYFALSDHPIIIDEGRKSFQLERKSGKKCYMLAARSLAITWGDTPEYWNWTTLPESRFPEVAELIDVCWLEIRGVINTLALSPNTRYASYLVFQMIDAYGFNRPVELSVGIFGSHSSTKDVCLDPLQPVIGLLSSCCSESQREAALLLGQFAATDSDCKVHIVQRGAVRPLIEMLQSPDVQLKEMSAFALGRLAQDPHNQAGIAHNGGLIPLLKLLDSKNGSLQHNAAFALYGLADNEDNVSDFIRVGGIQRLQDGEFIVQATKDCVAKTMKRLEEKIHGRVLNHLLYLMRVSEKAFQRRFALALAHLCSEDDQRKIFIDHIGLELLMGLLGSSNPKQQLDGAVALCKLAYKAMTLSPVDAAPPSPTPQVYLGEQYVNNATLSDVTFLVEGKRFYAHRICLLASSDAFRAMFDGGYREKDARDIEIPNIRWEVFELTMRFIYTGSVDVTLDIAQDLLRAADQYLLEGLKRLCEYTIAQDISLDNVSSMYEFSEAFNAISLRHTCILFILEHFDKLSARPGHSHLIQRIIPEIRNYFVKALTKANSNVQL